MRPPCPAITVVGSASSVAATAAVLPPAAPLETDPVILGVVWATAAVWANGLVRTGWRRLVTRLTILLTVLCLVTIGVETVRERRWERSSVLPALLVACLASLAAGAGRWTTAYPMAAPAEGPGPLGAEGEPTRPQPAQTARQRVLKGRWLVAPGPLADADRGGFSVVRQATDLRRPDRRVVVKLASRPFDADDDSVARLTREAGILARLHSPYVVGLRDSGWEAGAFFVVLDYHPAGSLARWLDRRFVLQLSTAIEAACELLRALAYLHRGLDRPLIHRDVTPRNVLVRSERPDLRLLLADFGSARQFDAHGHATESAVTAGSVFSPFYAPPELVGGVHGGQWGPQTDVYGVFAILYELLTGLPPYQREARRRSVEFRRLVLDPSVIPSPPGRITPGLPYILDQLVAAGLAYDPTARLARAEDLLPVLEEIGSRHGAVRIPFADLRRSR